MESLNIQEDYEECPEYRIVYQTVYLGHTLMSSIGVLYLQFIRVLIAQLVRKDLPSPVFIQSMLAKILVCAPHAV